MATRSRRFYGKYRGTVTQNLDPQAQGRIQVQVPEVLGATATPWALPCLPLAGPEACVAAVPAVGDSVWVEFEAGRADRPVWVGCFWPAPGQAPSPGGGGAPALLLRVGRAQLSLSEGAGPDAGVSLRVGAAHLSIGDAGITLGNGQGATITLRGPAIDCNGGALTVV